MRIDLVYPALPPTLDGIADHTAHLARGLVSRTEAVRVLTAQDEWAPLPGVTVKSAFHLPPRRGILDVVGSIRSAPPDWLLIQFEQFAYGRWGLNPFLPWAVVRLRALCPDVGIAVLFHEDFYPVDGVRGALMSAWQRLQFLTLGRLADVAFFATETWIDAYRNWFPSTRLHHSPVGSNIPVVDASGTDERARHGIPPDAFVLGLFGSAHPSRLLRHVNAAVQACTKVHPGTHVLYVGPDGRSVRASLDASVSVHDAGVLSPEAVSRCFAAMDLYLAPFEDGVSTRRGSFMTGIQHACATISTRGRETGFLLRVHDGNAFRLTPWRDRTAFATAAARLARAPAQRQRLESGARPLYASTFDWDVLADTLLSHLTTAPTTRAPWSASSR